MSWRGTQVYLHYAYWSEWRTGQRKYAATGSTPRIEQRWSLDELETSVSAFFADRDPGRMFAATEILGES